jgi:hypothetical protein
MKIKIRVYGNTKDDILFEGKLDVLPNCEHAIVVYPEGTKIQHLIWDNEFYHPVEVKDLKKDFTYWFTWDD